MTPRGRVGAHARTSAREQGEPRGCLPENRDTFGRGVRVVMRRKASAHAREQDEPHAKGCIASAVWPFFHACGPRSRRLRPSAHAALPLPLVPLVGGAPCGTVLCHEPEKLTLSAPHDARMMVPVRTRARTRRLPEDSGRLGKLAGWVAHLAGVSGAHVGSADASRMSTRQATRTVQTPSVSHSIRCPPADKWRPKSPLIACGGIVPCDLHTTSP